jgi:predicted RNA binding protein YcfA (HicA-like mRNA interferase family)
MPPMPSLNWADVVRAFEKIGWRHDRTNGSHYIMVRDGRPGLLSIPMHKPVKRGTLRRLIRDAGLTVEAFVRLV